MPGGTNLHDSIPVYGFVNVALDKENGVHANSQHTPSRMPQMRNGTDLFYHRTPMGGRGPRLLWLLWAEFSESN